MTKTMESPAPVAQRETDVSPLEGVGTHQAVEQQYYDREFDDIVARYMAAETFDDIENTRTALTTSLAMPVRTHETPQPTTPVEAIEEHETAEPKKSFLRRSLGRLSLSRLGAEMSITQMNMAERKQQLVEKAERAEETGEKLTRMERVRLAIGRRGLALATGAMAVGGIVANALALSRGIDFGTSHGTVRMDYETAAVIKPLEPGAPNSPLFIGGREQGTNDAMAHAAKSAGTATFGDKPRTVYYPGQIRGVGGDTITMKDSIDQGTASALKVVKSGDVVYAHSEGSGVARNVAQARPDVKVVTNSDPYAGLLAADGPAAAIKKPLEGIFGIPVGIKGGPNVTTNVDEFDALAGVGMINNDKTFNPTKTLESVVGTAAGGRHGLDRLTGKPIETRTATDGTTINIYNKGTGVKSGITGQEFKSPISASLKQHQNIDIGPLDNAIVAARGDKDGKIDAVAVGNAVAPGLGNALGPVAQPFVDLIQPVQATVINGVNQATNPGSAPIVKTSGGNGGNTFANTLNQFAPAAGKKTGAPISVNANVNIPAPAPAMPNIPTPQQIQADPAGAAMNFIGGLLGGARR